MRNKIVFKNLHLVYVALFILLSIKVNGQALYSYNNDPTGLPGAVAPNVTASSLSWVNGPTSINFCGDGFNSQNWSTSTGAFSTAYSAVQFTLTPDPGYAMNVNFIELGVRRNPQGPTRYRFAYSLNGGLTWIDSGSDFIPPSSACGVGTSYIWDMPDFTTSVPIIIRLYGWNSANSVGQQQVLASSIVGTPCQLLTWYADADGDGYGNPGVSTLSCTAPAGYVSAGTDCNDANASVKPGATETCNGVDDDCDGSIDEGVLSTFYADTDGDGYGNAGSVILSCTAPVGYVSNSLDCNDTNASVKPGATETCNGVDDDCDGSIDEGLTFIDYFIDSDGDGFGDALGSPTSSCSPLAGFSLNNQDCDDASSGINPGASEVCNGSDDNCDGSIDEGVIDATVMTPYGLSVCKPDYLTLETPVIAGATYQWFKNGSVIAGATASSFQTNKPAFYQVQVNVTGGCFDLSDEVYVTVLPPVNSNIYAPNGTSLCNTVKLKASYNATYTWQWNLDGALIPAATNWQYYPAVAGSYTCLVTNAVGCSRESAPILVTACRSDDPEFTSDRPNVYPNPNNGTFGVTMHASQTEGNAQVFILNMLGQCVYVSELAYNESSISTVMDVDHLPSGVYTLIVSEFEHTVKQQFIIQR